MIGMGAVYVGHSFSIIHVYKTAGRVGNLIFLLFCCERGLSVFITDSYFCNNHTTKCMAVGYDAQQLFFVVLLLCSCCVGICVEYQYVKFILQQNNKQKATTGFYLPIRV